MNDQNSGTPFNESIAMLGAHFASELVTIANNSDMGDIREDATNEVLRKLIRQAPDGMLSPVLAETVKMLAVALAAYSDEIQGRNPLRPTDGPAQDL